MRMKTPETTKTHEGALDLPESSISPASNVIFTIMNREYLSEIAFSITSSVQKQRAL